MKIDYMIHNKIHGVMYTPGIDRKVPLIIFAHGYCGDLTMLEHYGPKCLEANIAIFFFDFCGGSLQSSSKGSMWDMSVLTEKKDYEEVLTFVSNLDYISDITLMGESQGGYVATLVAGKHSECGLILWYPAFVIERDCKERARKGYKDQNYVWGMPMGRKYIEDALKINIFEETKKYKGNVLILHGNQDNVAPISDSVHALETFPDATLYTVIGAGHGFEGNQRWEVIDQCIQYVKKRG